ncbi:MAG TPA: M48 family metalloprotease [Xanthobacteraceae bacterium]|nr:M48 family metalloprotease [Xanthobacteraceae bacterium]
MRDEHRHLGERLHSLFLRGYGLKERDFSHDAVERAMAALNAARSPQPAMTGEVLWITSPIAFTLPGQYCYISRRLIERCTSDAPVAFALAHEIGHHDLGHLNIAESWAASAVEHAPWQLALLALSQLPKWIYSRDMEFAADAYALKLCRKAGFDPAKCLECLDILSRYLLDNRDLDGVYGSDDELELDSQQAANAVDWLFIEARLWLARHRRSHPAIQERRRALLSQLGRAA